ncbi:hypothetical protein AB0467_24055 [Streptomyces sp. NPDC052095]|uniref:hypothetical protein n=1 Tax=unclassified Streptomyces TaxID=2593676 RepID=UPI00344BF9AC
MNGREWDDDSDYEEAVARARTATWVGLSTIAGVILAVAAVAASLVVFGLLFMLGVSYADAWS